jgi:hypothetical protein
MKKLLFLVIWPDGHEEKFYVDDWLDLHNVITIFSERHGLPDLIYRKL